MKKKRILYVDDFLEGGGAEKVCNETFLLMKEKYKVDYFYSTKQITKPNNLFEYIYNQKYFIEFLNKLEDFQPDIIHLHNFYHKLSPSILDAIREYRINNKVKVLMTVHDFHIVSPNSGYTHFTWFSNKIIKINNKINFFQFYFYKWDHRGFFHSLAKQLQWIYNYKVKKLHRQIDIFISPSEFLANVLSIYHNQEIYTIRNLADYSKEKFSQNYLKSNDIFFAGRLSTEKGLDIFIHRMKEIQNNSFNLYVAGDGKEKDNLIKLVEELNLEKRVFFLGHQSKEEMYKLYAKHSALVLSSVWYENAPLSLVEAAMNNMKLITMSYGGMGELATICGNYIFLDKCTNEELINFINGTDFIKNKNLSYIFSEKEYISKLCQLYSI